MFIAIVTAFALGAPESVSGDDATAPELLVKQCRYVLKALAKKPETLKFSGTSSEVSDDEHLIHLEFSVERLEGLPLPGGLTCTFTGDDGDQVMTLFTFKPRDQKPESYKPGRFPELAAALERIRKGLEP